MTKEEVKLLGELLQKLEDSTSTGQELDAALAQGKTGIPGKQWLVAENERNAMKMVRNVCDDLDH